MRVVIDTNVIISALFYGGLPNAVLELVANDKIQHIASEEIIAEYKEMVEKIACKTSVSNKTTALNILLSKMELIYTTSDIKICRDPDDDKFINCAIDGKCKYIVSGDKDLLVLKNFEDIEIMTVREFMEEWNKQ